MLARKLLCQKWIFLERSLSETAIEISMNRFSAIHLEMKQQKERIKSYPNFRLTNEVAEKIQKFMEIVYLRVPPPSAFSEAASEAIASATHNLAELELNLRQELQSLKGMRVSKLSPETIQSVHDAIHRFEQILSSYPVERESSEDMSVTHLKVPLNKTATIQELKKQQWTIFYEAQNQINALTMDPQRGAKTRNILQTAINEYHELYKTHKSRMDLDTLVAFISRLVTLAENCGWIQTLSHTHGIFFTQLLTHTQELTVHTDLSGINTIFWGIKSFGSKLSFLRGLHFEVNKIISVACGKAQEHVSEMSPLNLEIIIKTLIFMGYNNCVPLLKLIVQRVNSNVEMMSQTQLLLLLRACAAFRLDSAVEFGSILSALNISKLPSRQLETLLWNVSKLPIKFTPNYDGPIRQFIHRILLQYKRCMRQSGEFQTYRVLWNLGEIGCFPGTEFLDLLAEVNFHRDQDSANYLASSFVCYASLNYCPEKFLTAVKEHWLKHSSNYSLQSACTVMFCLCLFEDLNQDSAELFKIKLSKHNAQDNYKSIMIRLAQIHFHCERVLKIISPVEGSWKELALHNRLQAIDKSPDLRVSRYLLSILEKMNYSIKNYETLKDVLLKVFIVEKDSQRYSLEIAGSKGKVFGERPVLNTKLLSREGILKSLDLGIIRIDPEKLRSCASAAEKINYINAMTTKPGENSKIIPDSIATQLKHSWNNPSVLEYKEDIKATLESELVLRIDKRDDSFENSESNDDIDDIKKEREQEKEEIS